MLIAVFLEDFQQLGFVYTCFSHIAFFQFITIEGFNFLLLFRAPANLQFTLARGDGLAHQL